MQTYTIKAPVWHNDISGPLIAYLCVSPHLHIGYCKHHQGWKVMYKHVGYFIHEFKFVLQNTYETEEEAKSIAEKLYYDYIRSYLKEVTNIQPKV